MVHVGLVETLFQFIGCAECADFAVHHDRDAVTVFCLVHIVGGDKNSDATRSRLIDEFPKLTARGRVNTSCGFVKKHYGWLMEYADAKGKFLFPTKWQRTYEVILVALKFQLA